MLSTLKRLSLPYRRTKSDNTFFGKRRSHSFVNSQEWTLSRSVPDLKLGILGSVQSGKSALVHRYLTGSYMQEESPEGGRFKKEVIIDGQSYLLLIRDEGGAPEMQFTQWVDAVIFVFSLENEISFQSVYQYYLKMTHFRNTAEIPLILVGTQDAISESNPRVIDDTRARKLANDLKRCSYYETCATYGLNVERVFQDACSRIVQFRYPSMPSALPNVPSTPNHSQRPYYMTQTSKPYDTHSTSSQSTSSSGTLVTRNDPNVIAQVPPTPKDMGKEEKSREKDKSEKKKDKHKHKDKEQPQEEEDEVDYPHSTPLSSRKSKKQSTAVQKSNSFSPQQAEKKQSPATQKLLKLKRCGKQFIYKSVTSRIKSPMQFWISQALQQTTHEYKAICDITHESDIGNTAQGATTIRQFTQSQTTPVLSRKNSKFLKSSFLSDSKPDSKELPTPTSTPTQSRKNRRRSNLFNPYRYQSHPIQLSVFNPKPKNKDKDKEKDKGQTEDDKKQEGEKLGCGRVIPIKQGYLYKKSHGLNKDWKKKYVTLLDDARLTYHPSLHDYMEDVHAKEIPLGHVTVKVPGMRPRGSRSTSTNQDPTNNGNIAMEMNNLSIGGGHRSRKLLDKRRHSMPNGDFNKLAVNNNANLSSKIETPNVKKRHRRAKSGGLKDPSQGDDSDGYEFHIVSLFNKQWQFEASSLDERDEWVAAIEQQILASLQGNESSGKKQSTTDPAGILAIRNTRGNNQCADCGAPAPEWASLNLGTLICIECSGIHRNLGTHLSRVRSLGLDEWPLDLIHVMTSIGNTVANSVWEFNLKGRTKPAPNGARNDKEQWIRAKYDSKEFLPPPPYVDIPLNQQLIDALVREDIRNIVLILGHANAEDITAPYSKDDGRTALHIAAALGNVVFVQLLLWQNANVKVVDHEGRNALWYAKSSGSQECVDLLMNSGCPEHPTLPRRRGSSHQSGGSGGKTDVFEKLPASVI
ncbi:arf-GAP with GTPase, ANK repeat and PH domain-containing protein 1-like isoform X4 [Mercenaria mercenaria]|uniref:arf-GAP with GTPase, ANK repeat and PH domain-containing protein 1-like isoform X4 n=1 Tax=Mercenaria mercenaria TaxID=6596 RepID=UPI00234F36C2|nr:arf-GAP with GTPase, ANK repeat and PH domain-containing protein 1-like isoform X4 [Mercenaria mercenaria]